MAKLYAIAISAERGSTMEIRPGVVSAENDDEALGKAYSEAKLVFPAAQGWRNISAMRREVPLHILKELEVSNEDESL